MTTSFDPTFPTGTVITGKWKRNRYTIRKLLGEGSNGKVYLVSKGRHEYAMKMGFSSLDLQSEINTLSAFSRASGGLAPYFVEADDFHAKGADYPFYIMKYIKGLRLHDYIKHKGDDWFYLVGYNLLRKLEHLHRKGWIFGDLKLENVLVSGYGDVDLIDYGGLTKKGKAVKQFTEIYDRGYWHAGSRIADEPYEIFSFAVLCLQFSDPDHPIGRKADILPQHRHVDYLLEWADNEAKTRKLLPFLRKALAGEYKSTAAARRDWKALLLEWHHPDKIPLRIPWLKALFAVSALLCGLTLYIVFM